MNLPEHPLRILLVEDHVATVSALTKALLRQGFAVASATSAGAAWEAALQQPFDLLITEIGLPQKNGWELFRELRRLRPELLAIAVTAYAYPEDVQRSKDVGIEIHLTKPATFQQVLGAIHQLFPNAKAGANADQSRQPVMPATPSRPRVLRVLHLEDDERDVELLQLTCQRHDPDCEITPATDREGFRRALQSGFFDGIVSDSSVHDLSGPEAVKLARKLAPGRPYVFLCGMMDPVKQLALVRANPDGIFSKDRAEDPALAINLIRKMNEYRHPPRGPVA